MPEIVATIIKVNKTYVTHTHHGVVVVWPLARKGTVAVCKWCELPVREPHCNL